MKRNTLPPLLPQFVAPVLQLRGDELDTGSLLKGPRFDTRGVLVAKLRVRELRHGVSSVFVQAFVELPEHFDGGADLSRAWRLHNQMWMPRDGFCAS
jgi:hypothetical protein